MAIRTWSSSSVSVVATAVGTSSPAEGVPLAAVSPKGKPLDPLLIAELAGMLARLTCVRKEALPARLFAVLGVRGDGLARFVERVPAMARRPYSLLHTDLGRDGVLIAYDGRPLSATGPAWTAACLCGPRPPRDR
ncbi:hypothetical protein [Streptomyces sp. NBC_01483]|uniref:hypothetical protein n=1 Tax=Streptomyces sp. NBC_01483 TaxID=2903883 RepID=UPI002E313895|nr:hypothetical protein [Streptomyces sp. NBC_01483]